MHETTRAQSILRAVFEKAQKEAIPIVNKVEVLINPAAGVDKEELLEIMDELKQSTFLRETIFELKDAGMQATCKSCGTIFTVNSPSDVCPSCGGSELELALLDQWDIGKME